MLRMAVVLRTDLPSMNEAHMTRGVAWTMLGMFKKLWKRRDEYLKAWDLHGRSLLVLGAASEEALLNAQAAARRISLPTHTYAGVPGQPKERSVMVVGPASERLLRETLPELQIL